MSNSLYLSRLTSRNNFDMSHYHLTTMDIGFPQIQMCQAVIPTDSLNFNCSSFMRLSPLVFPTYARMRHKFINAFVPNYLVDEYFEYAQDGIKQVGTMYTHPLTLRFTDLMRAFSRTGYSSNSSSTDYDFKIYTGGGNPAYRKLTARGRRAYKIIKDLGYELVSYDSTRYMSDDIEFLSAYPLLCYAQFVNDVILPQQYHNTSALNSLLESVKHRHTDYLTISNLRVYISESCIELLLDHLTSAFAMYRDDYFTTAWAKPNQVTTNSPNTVVTFDYIDENTDGDLTKLQVHYQENNNFIDTDDQNYSSNINARSLQALQMFDKWVRRNNYVGNSTLNRLYSRFGIKPQQVRSHYTDVINQGSVPVVISDVTSFSDTKTTTGGSDLGAYVGKGYSSGNIKCSFKSPDFGYVFCVSYIECDPLYDHGVNRDVLVTDFEDFYQPEFDGLQASPVLRLETGHTKGDVPTAQVFGYQPHYEWMRSHRDNVSGDLLTNDLMKSWFTAKSRNLMLAQQEVTLMYQLGTFNHIFQDSGNDMDHFICSFDFDMKMNRPLKSSSQATGLEQGDIKVEKFGNK